MPKIHEKPASSQTFWAVTSYFNPARWRRRRHNYDIFRNHLSTPLLTVEFSSDGQFELKPEDADILIQVSGGDVMWQKERLLSLGINALPACAEYVAWLDCDIVFEDIDWSQKAIKELERVKVLQPFSNVVHLTAAASTHFSRDSIHKPENILYDNEWSIGHLLETGGNPWIGRTQAWLSGTLLPASSPGIAWMAKRDTLLQIGLYENFVLGSGDRVAMSGFLGNFASLKTLLGDVISPAMLDDCYRWMESTFSEINGSIGYIPGRVINLWHGETKDRQYILRHEILKHHGFDPAMDIRIGPEGAWQWASDKPELHAAVQRYFVERHEDG